MSFLSISFQSGLGKSKKVKKLSEVEKNGLKHRKKCNLSQRGISYEQNSDEMQIATINIYQMFEEYYALSRMCDV